MTASHPTAELALGTPDTLKNLDALTHKAYVLDENTLLHIRARKTTAGTAAGIGPSSASTAAPAMSQVWVKALIGPLAMRAIALHTLPDDIIVTAAEIKDIAVRVFAQAKSSDNAENKDASLTALPYRVHAQSAPSWPGFLPVPEGWQVVDYAPTTAFRTLEKQGRAVAVESSSPVDIPPSLPDRKVLIVSGGIGETTADTREGQSQETSKSMVDVTMQDVFALYAMGFIPEQPDEKELVRVSAKRWWRQLGRQFGSIFMLESLGVLPLAN